MTNLERQKNSFIVLAAIRSQREGHITTQQREYFAALAPHVRAAVRTHLALEGHGTAVLVGAMEALAIPVFVCDRSGRVKSLTRAAEDLVTSCRGLELRAGQLLASEWADASALGKAIDAVVIGHVVAGPPVMRRSSSAVETTMHHRWYSMCSRCRFSSTSSALSRVC